MEASSPKSARLPRPFPGFAGVALADILANSVAIIIIMIVVSIMVRHQQEQERIEQTEEVSVLLSRELASSFVMNDLPTSPPAVLHDYVTSPLDRNPSHASMPIIEFHDGFIRDYYTGVIYTRDELLVKDNPFDEYLANLSGGQLARIRADIYSIDVFYIVMSILKALNAQPRHWHFLGYPAKGESGWIGMEALRSLRDSRRSGRRPGEADGDGQGRGSGGALGRDSGRERNNRAGSLPRDVEPTFVPGGARNYPVDLLGRSGQGSGLPQEETLDLPGQGPLGQGQRSGARDVPRQSADLPGGGPRMLFRSATPRSLNSENMRSIQGVPRRDWIIRGLLAYMGEVQSETDKQMPSPLTNFNFLQNLEEALGRLPEEQDLDYLLAFRDAEIAMAQKPPELSTDPALTVQTMEEGVGQELALPVNQRLETIRLRRDPDQGAITLNPALASVSIHLGLHAEVYEGLRMRLFQGSILLMPLPQIPDPEPRWRVVTLIAPELDDYVVGFLYGSIDEEGRLLLPVDINAVEFGGLRLETRLSVIPFRHELWRLAIYGLLVALALVGVFYGRRKFA